MKHRLRKLPLSNMTEIDRVGKILLIYIKTYIYFI